MDRASRLPTAKLAPTPGRSSMASSRPICRSRPHCAANDHRARRRGHRMNWRSVRLMALIPIWFSIGGVAFPQKPDRIYRLGVLSVSPGTLQRLRAVMFPELARLGFTEGRNLVVEARFGPMEELPALAR